MWQSIKVYSKLIAITIVIIYALAFVYTNSAKAVTFWWWYNRELQTSVLFLTAGAFIAGVLAWVLFRALWKTLRQLRTVRARAKTEQMERDVAEMKAKASILKTRPGGVQVEPLSDRIG